MYHEAYLAKWPRSVLRPIKPIGAGLNVESLASYCWRLAWHHSVKPAVLFGTLLDPGKSSGFLTNEVATCFNSMTEKTAELSERIAKFVGLSIADMLPMTLLHWRDTLDPVAHGLIRKTKHWCPQCFYQDGKRRCRIRYERLVWSLAGVEVCPEHHCKLRSICFHCRELQPYVSSKVAIGFCHHCFKPLEDRLADPLPEQIVQQSKPFSDLALRRKSADGPFYSHLRFIEELKYLIGVRTDGSLADFANEVGFDRHVVEKWLRGEARPTAHSLIQVFGIYGIAPSEVLSGQESIYGMHLKGIIPGLIHPRLRGRFVMSPYEPAKVRDGQLVALSSPKPELIHSTDKVERVQAYLNEVLQGIRPPKSRNHIAEELAVSVGFLERHFGKAVREISLLYNVHCKENALDRLSLLDSYVLAAVGECVRAGMAPSWRAVIDHLPTKIIKRFSITELSDSRTKAISAYFERKQVSVSSAFI